jgi:hypothetical protein
MLVPLRYVELGLTVIKRAFMLSVFVAGCDTLPELVRANRNCMWEVIMMQ